MISSNSPMARSRHEKDDLPEKHVGLLKLVQILSLLVVFVAGVIVGLVTNSHINRYFSSKAELFFKSTTTGNENCTVVKKKMECMNIEEFAHPKNLSHGMSDDEIFWRASLVAKRKEYPFRKVPKVAFMFLTRGPLPMLPLWEKFFGRRHKYFSVYVHAPHGYLLNVSSDSPFSGRQIPSQEVSWGSISLLDAERRLLANALLDFSNERFVLLSESCIPIYNFWTVYKYLMRSRLSFVESYDDPSRYGRGRYSRNMAPDIWVRQWRKGSQWFEMSRSLAVQIVSDAKYYTVFKRFCRPSCYPDEHYIPTYLNMFHGPKNSNRSVTWVDWSAGGPHPMTYHTENITESLIKMLRNNGTQCLYNFEFVSVCYLFARKFAPSALKPLLNLTTTMGF